MTCLSPRIFKDFSTSVTAVIDCLKRIFILTNKAMESLDSFLAKASLGWVKVTRHGRPYHAMTNLSM